MRPQRAIVPYTYVWSQLEVGRAARDVLVMWVVQVTVHDLFRVGQRTVQAAHEDMSVHGRERYI